MTCICQPPRAESLASMRIEFVQIVPTSSRWHHTPHTPATHPSVVTSQYCCHSIVVTVLLSQCCRSLPQCCCHSVVVVVPQLPEVSWETASVRTTPQDTPRTPPRQQVRNLVYTDTCPNSRSLRRLLTYLLGTACTQTLPSACTPQLGTASGYLPR
jgi:hypothetical protein